MPLATTDLFSTAAVRHARSVVARGGDPSWRQFFALDYPRIVASVARHCGDRELAADAVSEALSRYLSRSTAPQIERVAAWVTVVAVNRARDVLRSAAAERRAIGRLAHPAERALDPIALDVDVRSALRALPEMQRRAVTMHYLLDRPVAEIARELGIHEGTVKTHLARARRTLAAELSSAA